MPKLNIRHLQKQFPKPVIVKRKRYKKMKVEKTQNGYAIDGFSEKELLTLYKKISGNKMLAAILLGNKVDLLLNEIERAIVVFDNKNITLKEIKK